MLANKDYCVYTLLQNNKYKISDLNKDLITLSRFTRSPLDNLDVIRLLDIFWRNSPNSNFQLVVGKV